MKMAASLPWLRLRRPFSNHYQILSTDLSLRRLPSSRIAIHRSLDRTQNSMSESVLTSKTTEEEEKKLPPPPEKPEPGDCCGSGCVRCVWDVYYDELEEYNKLLNHIDQSLPDSVSLST